MGDIDVDFEALKENKFAHLLKPIRDLQDNFNIDLAHELEEYLEQLENAQFTFEGGAHPVDFAEAALLIQGSTMVFSKKVEYLYNLTYQALEAVKGRRRPVGADGQPLDGDAAQPVAGARGRAGAVARGAEDDEDDGLERFWEVEDLLKEAGDIDLADGECSVPTAGSAMRPPAALLALEDQAQGATTSVASGKAGDGDSGVYRLQQCTVHCSGALLLDPRDGDMYDSKLRFIGPQPRRDKDFEQLVEAHQMTQPTQPFPQPATQVHVPPPGQQQAAPQGDPMDLGPDQAMDYDDDGGGGYGGGGDWPDDDDMAPAPAPGDVDGKGPEEAALARDADAAAPERVVTRQQAAGNGGAASLGDTDAAASLGSGQEADGEPADEEVFDPYKPLDPSAKSRLPDRPLVVSKPRRAQRKPAGATAKASAGAAVTCGLLLPEFSYCLQFLRQALAPPEAKVQRVAKKNALDKVARARDKPAPVFDAADAAAAVAADEAAVDEPPEQVAAPLDGFDDDDDGGGYGGGGASDLDDDVGPGGNAMFGDDAGDLGAAWHEPGGGAEDGEAGGWPGKRGLWSGPVPPMGSLAGSEDGMAVDGEEPSYEELCRAHMESMLMAAAARQVQSDLARRVSGWRQRIDPVLKAEESRPAFDIQDYGDLIISRLSGLKLTGEGPAEAEGQQPEQQPAGSGAAPPVRFSLVAAQLQKFEVSRMFSAMLQLINNRNVAIYKADASQVPPGEVPDEPFTLELLSTDLYHKTMGARLVAPKNGAAGAQTAAEGGDDEEENRATQPARGKTGAGGRAAGGGGKRAKRAAVEPLANSNTDDA